MGKRRRPVVVLGIVSLLLLTVGAVIVFRLATTCTSLVMWTSDEKFTQLQTVAQMFHDSGPKVDGRCVLVQVTITNSRMTADLLAQDPSTPWTGGAQPDLWSPSSSVWVRRLENSIATVHKGRVHTVGSTEPLITTPVIIAMPEPMAKVLGWPNAKIGWHDLLALARDPRGWGAKGHPEWGAFTLGKTNPAESTTGLLSTISTVTAISGTDGELTLGDLPRVEDDMRAIEGATVHYGIHEETFVNNMYEADQEGHGLDYVSAIAMEEKVLLDYNRGILLGDPPHIVAPPKTKLAAIFPTDGTMASDDPALVLDADWVSPAHRRAAEAFLSFARQHQDVFLDAGFRTAELEPGPLQTLANGTVPHPQYRQVLTPSNDVIEGVRALWQRTRRRANVLLVMDVSGSMRNDVAGSDKTQLQLAQDAAAVIPQQLAGDDRLGLWEFSNEIGSDPHPWRELVPLAPVSVDGATFTDKIEGLQANGETALYATTRAAVQDLSAQFDPKRINAVILLTDGENNYARDSDRDALLRDLRASNKDRQVRVFTIAYGDQADTQTLQLISQASRASEYDSTDPTQIQNVMLDVLSNF
jgi:Ca-activated chloride channel family protein